MRLCDLFKAQKMNSTQCVLDNENIQGRVTYVALLDKDLVYCNAANSQCVEGKYVSPASGDKVDDLPTEQHFVSRDTTGFLNLGKDGGNLLIPSFYEDWVAFSGWWNHLDFMASTMLGVSMLFYNKNNLKELEHTKENLAYLGEQSTMTSTLVGHQGELMKVSGTLSDTVSAVKTEIAAGHVAGVPAADIDDVDSMLKRLSILGEAESEANKKARAAAKKIVDEINRGSFQIKGDWLKDLGTTRITDLTIPDIKVTGAHAGVIDLKGEVQRYSSVGGTYWDLTLSQEMKRVKYKDELQLLHDKIDITTKLTELFSRRALGSMLIGGVFLGPARFLFSVNDRIFFTMRDAGKEQYMRVYVSHPDIAVDFKRASDLWGTGRLMEVIAKYFTVPLPAKAFQAGKVFLIHSGERRKGFGNKLFRQASVDGQVDLVGRFLRNQLRGRQRLRHGRQDYELAVQTSPDCSQCGCEPAERSDDNHLRLLALDALRYCEERGKHSRQPRFGNSFFPLVERTDY